MHLETTRVTGNSSGCGYDPEHLLDSRYDSLVVRNWRSGERFWPFHTSRPRKIKELLQDRHIIGEEKGQWPVVVSGNDIVWVRGFGVGNGFQAKDPAGVLIRELPATDENS
jgi:tRNA(Ile)-lysidine synthetase-like protein